MIIPLCEAPAVYFDKRIWGNFCNCFANTELALMRLSQGPFYQGSFAQCYPLLIKSPSLPGIEASSIQNLKDKLVKPLRYRLINKSLRASGILLGCGKREMIATAAWMSDIWPDFCSNRVYNLTIEYSDVLLEETLLARDLERVTDWMRRKDAEGVTSRKELKELAKEQFKKAVPTSVFNLCYSSVFKRKKGRPPKVGTSSEI